jgi:hypothetical protein
MDPSQIFAGAGASGGVVMALFVLYKVLQSSHCRSNCCGRIVSVDVSQKTPPPEEKKEERRPSVFVPEDTKDTASEKHNGPPLAP